MKRSLLIPALLLLAAVVIPNALSFAGPQAPEAVAPVSVFFVRHAETAASTRTNRNPELSELGAARGEALAALLKKVGATHLFSSEYTRTQSTLAALAKQTSLEVKVVEARKMDDQIAKLQALPAGSVAVVCGHSNTVPAMVAASGGSIKELKNLPATEQVLAHESYDRLFLVVLPAAEGVKAKSFELRYGAEMVSADADH
ncbi:MAG: histidine phosphatase family protein [Planctomycetes bacterium]|nr:histidine phosphatase family protein [Planctomycetota bacterium]MCP4770863.1 histidine phosphatase family protein [Planctomycetota bacterium]MCP4862312.1 histidine phosphatase family protein [Planctomycetota bacterium]